MVLCRIMAIIALINAIIGLLIKDHAAVGAWMAVVTGTIIREDIQRKLRR